PGFSPMSGTAGTDVTITGIHLDSPTKVEFAGVSASFTPVSDTELTATVPSTAPSGPITVTTTYGVATSADDFVPVPAISSFFPTSGDPGTIVNVTGTNLSGATAVTFNGTPATTFSSVATLVTGTVGVTNPGGSAFSSSTFKVLPKLTSFSPGSGAEFSSVTITGSGFTDVSAVKFNGVAAWSYSVDSPTQITATVPPQATTGK